MAEKLLADASPEKRLFISLITRDIPLVDAFLDIIDNSINAALEPLAQDLKTADDYQALVANTRIKPKVTIEISVSPSKISVTDSAQGISSAVAVNHVFRFGRAEDETVGTDRLSVYGIGLKRAMFKCGNKIRMISDHREGGFDLKLDVREWEKIQDGPWQFEITPRAPQRTELGTSITITELNDDVRRRIDDGLFQEQLRERISKTYAFFIGRVVTIKLNNKEIPKELFAISKNHTSEKFKLGKVSCNVTAGIGTPEGNSFRHGNAGWFVFCNGRAVLFADKTAVTGWGGAGLPIFQPKHRPFLGTVFFVSPNPEELPWTTTKSALNEENAAWQQAKRHMLTVGRAIVGFLDKRYTDEGTEFKPSELSDATGGTMEVLAAATASPRLFKVPTRATPTNLKIQYTAKISDVKKIATHIRRPGIGGSAIGRYTFDYFLKNEVGSDE